MFSEGVLVRYIVPYLGEINSMRLGLLSFSGKALSSVADCLLLRYPYCDIACLSTVPVSGPYPLLQPVIAIVRDVCHHRLNTSLIRYPA